MPEVSERRRVDAGDLLRREPEQSGSQPGVDDVDLRLRTHPRAEALAPRGETHSQEQVLKEPEMALSRLPVGSHLFRRRRHVQQLTGLRRNMPQEVGQRLTLADSAERDGIAFDGRSNEVIEPASSG